METNRQTVRQTDRQTNRHGVIKTATEAKGQT